MQLRFITFLQVGKTSQKGYVICRRWPGWVLTLALYPTLLRCVMRAYKAEGPPLAAGTTPGLRARRRGG